LLAVPGGGSTLSKREYETGSMGSSNCLKLRKLNILQVMMKSSEDAFL